MPNDQSIAKVREKHCHGSVPTKVNGLSKARFSFLYPKQQPKSALRPLSGTSRLGQNLLASMLVSLPESYVSVRRSYSNLTRSLLLNCFQPIPYISEA